MSSKKYGLILPEKTKPQLSFQASRNVFGNDSDSEDETSKTQQLLRPSHNINRQSKINQEKAVIEDPTVYQYDEIYDSMVAQKESKKVKGKEEKKPKYIENLIKTANKRKIENERRVERQIQKEREKEGDEFADKEVFVTSAYKKKLEEMKKEEEREKYEEYLESIGDVTRQQDLGGFYRHLYEQKLGTSPKKSDILNNEAVNQDLMEPETASLDKNKGDEKKHKQKSPKSRNYRKRKMSSDNKTQLSEGEIEDSDEEINRCNLEEIRISKKSKQIDENIDADSDFSIDESSEEESEPKKIEQPSSEDKFMKPLVADSNKTNNSDLQIKENDESEITTEEKPKIKIDIWKKRTVGEVFDQALKRYYERKAARGI